MGRKDVAERNAQAVQGVPDDRSASPPPLLSPRYDTRMIPGRHEERVWRHGCALREEERSELARQAYRIDTACRPASPRELAEHLINPILQEMPVSEESVGFRTEGYLEALDGVPLFAAIMARQAFRQDRSGLSPNYAPTPAQLARLARRMAEPWRLERAEIYRLLSLQEAAKPLGPEERKAEEERRSRHVAARLRWLCG